MSFNYKNNDIDILHIPPQYPGDARVYKATDFYTQSILNQRNLKNLPLSEDYISTLPELQFTESNSGNKIFVEISNLIFSLVNYPSKEITVNTTLQLFDKLTTPQTKSINQYLHIFSFLSEIGEVQDPLLGNTDLEYYAPNFESISPDYQNIELQIKENTRRLRAFWGIILSENQKVSINSINSLIDTNDNLPSITIPNSEEFIDFNLISGDNARIYILDPNFQANKKYFIMPDFFTILPFLKLKRNFGFYSNGYYWGENNKELLPQPKYNATWVKTDFNEEIYPEKYISLLLSDNPSQDNFLEINLTKYVYNLFSGVNNQGDQLGININSPNGFPCLPSPDRIQFKNEEYNQTQTCKKRQLLKNDNNNLYATYPLDLGNISLVNGEMIAKFNKEPTSHIIYDDQGAILTKGSFSIEDDVLTWFPETHSSLGENDYIYIQPSIIFKSGSGLNLSAVTLEKCNLDYNNISQTITNIKDAEDEDINQYVTPTNSEEFIVVFGRERNAIHYIYRKVTLTSNGNGIINTDNLSNSGVIAFIEGVDGRIDKPLVKMQANFTNYNCLIYHVPSLTEKWQFEFTAHNPIYEDLSKLENSQIISDFVQIAHTQGGGASVYQTGGELRFSNFDLKLKPLSSPTYPSYILNTPIIFGGEEGYESIGWRFVTFPPGIGVSYPKKGERIKINSGTLYQRQHKLGYLMPELKTKLPYQSLFCFICKTVTNEYLLVIIKSNLVSGTVTFEMGDNSSISVFNIQEI